MLPEERLDIADLDGRPVMLGSFAGQEDAGHRDRLLLTLGFAGGFRQQHEPVFNR